MSEDFEKRFEDTFLSEKVQRFLGKVDAAAFGTVTSYKPDREAVQMFALAVFRHGYVEGFKAREARQDDAPK
jgi:hypothetical protein